MPLVAAVALAVVVMCTVDHHAAAASLTAVSTFQAPGTVTTVATTVNPVIHVIMDPADTTVYMTQIYSVNRILPTSTTVQLIAGSVATPGFNDGVGAAARFNVPYGIAQGIHNRSLLYVAEYVNNCLRTVHILSGTVTTLAGQCGPLGAGATDGIGTAARFAKPCGLAIARIRPTVAAPAVEVLYVSDYNNSLIRRVDVATGAVSTFAVSGDGSSFVALDIAVVLDAATVNNTDGGSGVLQWLLAADLNHKVRLVRATTDSSGAVTTVAGSVAGGLLDGVGNAATFNGPHGITVVDEGALGGGVVAYVVDYGNCAIRHVTMGGVVTTVSGAQGCLRIGVVDGPAISATFDLPVGARAYSRRNTSTGSTDHWLLIADYYNNAVRRFVVNSTTTRSPSLSQLTTGTASMTSTESPRSNSPSASVGVSATPTITLPSSSNSGSASSISSSQPTPSPSHSLSESSATQRERSSSVSLSSWDCGTLVVTMNASLDALNVVPDISGARTVALQPTERPDPRRPGDARVVLEAMAVPRKALMWTASEPVPLLALRLPAAWASAWRWRVVSARSLLHDDAPLDFAEDAAGRTVTLHAPRSSSLGWLPGSVVATESTWIMVALVLACASEGGNVTGRTATVVVAVPAPGAAPAITQAVATAATLAQWTTVVGGPGSGSAVGRVGAVRSIVLCGAGNGDEGDGTGGPSGGGLLGVAIAAGGPSCAGGSSASSARGAVVGNGGILACCAALVGLSTAAYAKARCCCALRLLRGSG